jgi:hypothetical protein
MSVLGLIAIPGMMTGALLGGAPVAQAARLQMVIVFMIASCTALAAGGATALCLAVAVDAQHRVRVDRIDARPHAVWRARAWVFGKVANAARAAVAPLVRAGKRMLGRGEEREAGAEGERQRLLG